MIGLSQARFDEPRHEGYHGVSRSWLSYSLNAGAISRHVRRRHGEMSTSTVQGLPGGGKLSEAFDAAWMRSPSPPVAVAGKQSIAVADLFAGCGGMSLGIVEAARALGLASRFSFASEMDPVKAKVYAANLVPAELHVGLVEQLLDGEVGGASTASERALLRRLGHTDILIGGPPCQGHSDLNNHTRRNDARNVLIGRMVRFAELVGPSTVVVENVQGARHDRGRSASKAADDLRALGYHVEELLVACLRTGVPQSRRRYMLVATKRCARDAIAEFQALDLGERSVGWAIEDLAHVRGDTIFDSSALHSNENTRRMRYLLEHDLYELPDSERPDCHRLKSHSYKGVYGRMAWDAPAPTITTGFGSTGQGRFVHPRHARTLTPHEAARLQTFPDFFDFGDAGRTQLQKMIGNSVPPLAMAALGMALLR